MRSRSLHLRDINVSSAVSPACAMPSYGLAVQSRPKTLHLDCFEKSPLELCLVNHAVHITLGAIVALNNNSIRCLLPSRSEDDPAEIYVGLLTGHKKSSINFKKLWMKLWMKLRMKFSFELFLRIFICRRNLI